ncbi:MAG TPA: PQQ-dependent sugar dehydrogenase [Vicinamibacterales bacterium]|nr:PQQ-dependent sugar dehydrogenase [Vicinamibacterales bacterium]
MVWLLSLSLAAGCGDSRPPTPSPPGTGTGETITGRERVGWDQQAANSAELGTFRYAMYVDGTRSELSEVSCAQTATATGFACSARLPAMSNGAHSLELAAFYDSGGIVESGKSAALRVTVTGVATPVDSAPLQPGDVITTADGVQLAADLLISGLEEVADIAVASSGRILVAERGGRLRIASGSALTEALVSRDGGIVSLALDPDFGRTGHVFIVHMSGAAFRIIRYRLVNGELIERMPLIRDIPASADASAALRFGPDGRLYAALDDGGSRDAAVKLSEWSGKILRLNPDGSTPADQPAASPVFWSGLRAPSGLDWTSPGATLWMAERGADGLERIRALVTPPERPRRAAQSATYVLPQPLGAGSLAFYRGDSVRSFAGNMFLAAREGRYLLRVRFDQQDPLRAVSSEKLLEGRIGQIRAVLAQPDGGLHVASESAVWRLASLAQR